jgi:hypothetical protein
MEERVGRTDSKVIDMLSVDTIFYRSIMLWLCNAYVSMPNP